MQYVLNILLFLEGKYIHCSLIIEVKKKYKNIYFYLCGTHSVNFGNFSTTSTQSKVLNPNILFLKFKIKLQTSKFYLLGYMYACW